MWSEDQAQCIENRLLCILNNSRNEADAHIAKTRSQNLWNFIFLTDLNLDKQGF